MEKNHPKGTSFHRQSTGKPFLPRKKSWFLLRELLTYMEVVQLATGRFSSTSFWLKP